MNRVAAMVALLLVGMAVSSVAIADDGPKTLVRARVEPSGPVAVGTTVKIVVDALVTTWLTEGLALPALEVPGAVVTPSDEQAAKLTETIAGVTWFGVSRVYLLTPTAAGTLTIPPIALTLHPGQAPGLVEAETAPLTVSVTAPRRPPGAEHALATRKLVLTQHLDRKLAGIRVGDSIERTISLTADGVRGMFLPPTTFDAVDGLAVYPADPHVDDVTDDRGAFSGGRRIDAATYVVQTSGRHALPAITVEWWNTQTQSLQIATAAAIELDAAPNPAARPELPLPADDDAHLAGGWRTWRNPALLGIVVVGAAVLMWGLAPTIVATRRRVTAAHAARRRRWEASEACAFERMTDTLAGGDPAAIYPALLHWLERVEPRDAAVTVTTLAARVGDPDLGRALAALGAAVYGGAAARRWETGDLAPRLTAARERLRLADATARAALPLPPLNP